ncbi:MAG: aminodeoxychorismate/anthranilate synthase component II [Phycisphaerae bacterium]|nr:aminodeoxychorismate/anthranilate synthase component II [Phycisphaerae bacterium]
MLVLIDNYDSFTYNLVQRFGEVAPRLPIRVFRNDEITIDAIAALRPTHLVISPGPCTPKEGGISNDVIKAFFGKVPILGVCLGHQCIGYSTGATIVRARRLMHGKTSMIRHDGRGVFRGMSNPFQATRYHSLVIDPPTLSSDFEVSATADDDPTEIMAIRHKTLAVEGVQFHPESFLTLEGHRLLANFVGVDYVPAHVG